MRCLRIASGLVLLASAPDGLAQQVTEPSPIDPGLITEAPYAYNGLIRVSGFRGSGSLVGDGVVATAAHVVYNEGIFDFFPASSVLYYPQYNTGNGTIPSSGEGYRAAALYKWDAYSARVQEDRDNGTPAGSSSPNTFNLDFAVAAFAPGINSERLKFYPEVHVDPEETVGILRDRRNKVLVGYPGVDPVPQANEGLMHVIEPADYFCWWEGLDGLDERDTDNFWFALYEFTDLVTYGGGSGGPMYVQDDLGNWVMAGLAVGGSSDSLSVRAVDENAWAWIEQAIQVRQQQVFIETGKYPLARVTDLEVDRAEPRRIWLKWTDLSAEESGYTVLRHFNGTYEKFAVLPPDTEQFIDSSIIPGHVYHYRVQPFTTNADRPPSRPPMSNEVAVSTPKSNPLLREALGLPWLQLTSDGDSTWFVDDQDRLRAGKVRSLGYSSLIFEIIGPGTLEFDWSSSSEENTYYFDLDYQDDFGRPLFGLVYDALYLFLNGEPFIVDQPLLPAGNEPLHLSGLKDTQSLLVELPAGPHTVEWRYEKDPYTDEYEDTGFLQSVAWTPDPELPYPVYGGYSDNGGTRHASEWFGYYEAELLPWLLHDELGWVRTLGNSGQGLWAYSSIEGIGYFYTSPDSFPFIYLAETGRWLYFFRGTGIHGQGVWFFDFEENRHITTGQ